MGGSNICSRYFFTASDGFARADGAAAMQLAVSKKKKSILADGVLIDVLPQR
jgi:hypothetical protein